MLKINEVNDLLSAKILRATEGLQNLVSCKQAYYSGVYFSLILALCYEETGRPDLDSKLWLYLKSTENPYPATQELVDKISYLSFGKIDLIESLVPNAGLRYGIPGRYYAMAIKDCLDLCVFDAREAFANENLETAYKRYSEWIVLQMNLVNI